ncbi:YkvA family protein [Acidovorax sp. GBBC 3334]|uniref:YkvA family protein n=1 Tax=Acidovorax sp. GBBC 3334 TaxID=2940496 RepID=UPI0023049A35|nr:YkvA family protein [Acidovorax sp. GBBC 3334]MDA8454718.1 YkvA family protein [Acidovorax sp. GBBC 3334]
MSAIATLRQWARRLKTETLTVYFAARDAGTPWAVRLLALGVAAYALSPIDLIPDFIPVLGYLDDVILVPLGLALVMRLLPPAVRARARQRAQEAAQRPRSLAMAVLFVAVWLAAAAGLGLWAWRRWGGAA